MDEHAPTPEPESRSRVTSGAFAMLLVIAAVGVWWLLSGNGPQGPGGNDPRYAVPDVDVSAPTDGPTDGPTDVPTDVPTGTDPTPAVPGGVRIDSYVVLDDLRLSLNYQVARCAPELGSPRVIETDASVTITLIAEADADCAGVLEGRTVAVLIDSPLDGRAVLDGSTSPLVRVEATEAAYVTDE
jgi:hypothetical protein